MTHTRIYLLIAATALVLTIKLFSSVHTAAVQINQQHHNNIEQALRDAGV